jgi:Fe-S-cluster containining protein
MTSRRDDAPPPASAIEGLHRDVDRATAPLEQLHADRLACRLGCTACCVDDLTVFGIEADRIRAAHPDLLEHGVPHPPGACAFLGEEGACRIYDARPYVCRTQGLPLRWLFEDASGEIAEQRSICELNVTATPLAALDEDACWLVGPVEDRLARLQAERDGEGVRRVELRSLFRRAAASERDDR